MTRKTARILVGTAFATCLIALPGHVLAGVSVSETSNAVVCSNEKSCEWLKQVCADEGGAYLKGAEASGKCDFPGQAGMKLTGIRKLTPRKASVTSLGQ